VIGFNNVDAENKQRRARHRATFATRAIATLELERRLSARERADEMWARDVMGLNLTYDDIRR